MCVETWGMCRVKSLRTVLVHCTREAVGSVSVPQNQFVISACYDLRFFPLHWPFIKDMGKGMVLRE